MSNDITEMVFILDRSGSMHSLTKDTIGGFNSLIENQKLEKGKALVTTVLFDNEYEILHDGLDINEVKPLTEKEYFPRGMTALMDAVGNTITTVSKRIDSLPEDYKPSKVMFVITTDGYENASQEYSRSLIKDMIEEKQTKNGWLFMFIGANMNAATEAASYGINQNFSRSYTASNIGTQSVYNSVAKGMSVMRNVDDWTTQEATAELSACLDDIQ